MSVYIVSAARTPIGSFNGSLSTVSAADLGAITIKEVLKRANIDGEIVDEIIMGQTLTAGCGQNTAKQAAWAAGIPQNVPAYVINMLCGSGVKSIVLGWQSILLGQNKVVICGGQENMSQAPHYIHLRNSTRKLGNFNLDDTIFRDGLNDAKHNIHMGVTAENIAASMNISRDEQDVFAAKSQQLTEFSQKNGFFNDEIVPVEVIDAAGNVTIFDTDEFPHHGTTKESLSKLESKFVKNGTVTVGNATGINDSAAAVLLMSEEEMVKRKVMPMAKIIGYAQGCVDPTKMGLGPAAAIPKLLKSIGWTTDEVDLYEINEAYASASIAVNRLCGINPDKVNIHGGTLALGHPLAASGTRILTTLIYSLKRTGGKKGVASLCIGGGMGIAIAIEIV